MKAWADGKESTADAQAERSDLPCPLSRSPGLWPTSQSQKGEGGMKREIFFLGIRQKVQKKGHFILL